MGILASWRMTGIHPERTVRGRRATGLALTPHYSAALGPRHHHIDPPRAALFED
jgi:hypothetical protein